MDADIVVGDAFRVVQVTPPRSASSISFGKGLTTAEPGSARRLILAVGDIDAAREDLVRRSVDVSGVFHLDGGPVPGPDPQGRSYQTYASFSDPGRQRLAASGDQDAASGPRVGALTTGRDLQYPRPRSPSGLDRELPRGAARARPRYCVEAQIRQPLSTAAASATRVERERPRAPRPDGVSEWSRRLCEIIGGAQSDGHPRGRP
jgi:hypothetical protein